MMEEAWREKRESCGGDPVDIVGTKTNTDRHGRITTQQTGKITRFAHVQVRITAPGGRGWRAGHQIRE